MKSVQAGSSHFLDSECEDFISSQSEKLPEKLAYTSEEDKKILKFVLKNGNIHKTTSISLWKKLECKMDKPKRTYQSLKNRFLRNIKPKIFTNFQNLILDDKTEHDILEKFPELEDSFKKYKKHKTLDICFKEENVETSDNQTKNRSIKSDDGIVLCGTDIHERKPIIEGDLITIIVNIKPNPMKETSKCVGLYKKFLSLETNSFPCSNCGGTGVLTRNVETESNEDEGRLIIDDSYENLPKKNNSSSASEEKSSNSSQNIISDNELEKLFEETVANRQIFMDSMEKKKTKE